MTLNRETEDRGLALGKWLNGESAASSGRVVADVAALIEEMLMAQKARTAAERESRLLNLTLKFEKYVGQIWPETISPDGKWNIYWTFAQRSQDQDEWGAVNLLVALARDGHLWRFKKCEFCCRWIFAVRSDQRFCGLKETGRRCRADFNEQPKQIQKRNEKRRNNHPQTKVLKAKVAAGTRAHANRSKARKRVR